MDVEKSISFFTCTAIMTITITKLLIYLEWKIKMQFILDNLDQ